MNSTFICAVRQMRISFMFFYFVFISFFCTAQDFADKHYWTELMRYNYLPIDSLWLFHPGSDFHRWIQMTLAGRLQILNYYRTKMAGL